MTLPLLNRTPEDGWQECDIPPPPWRALSTTLCDVRTISLALHPFPSRVALGTLSSCGMMFDWRYPQQTLLPTEDRFSEGRKEPIRASPSQLGVGTDGLAHLARRTPGYLCGALHPGHELKPAHSVESSGALPGGGSPTRRGAPPRRREDCQPACPPLPSATVRR